jgi:acyl carrier protein
MAAPLSEITAIVRDVMGDRDVDLSLSTRFDELANWNFMDLIAVMVEAECRYGLQFDLPEIDRLITIGDLLDLVAAKQAVALA